MTSKWMFLSLAASLICAAGCDEKTEPAGATAPTAAPAPAAAAPAPAAPVATATPEEAKAFRADAWFATVRPARVTGPGSAALKPQPRDLSDPAWQTSVDDAYIRKVLLGGGAAVGKSLIMPGNPDLKGKEAMQDELIKVVRGLKK